MDDAAPAAKCPFDHSVGGGTSNKDWWPKHLPLDLLHQHSSKSDPMDAGFDYAQAFKKLDYTALAVACLLLAARFARQGRPGPAWFRGLTGVLFLAGFAGVAERRQSSQPALRRPANGLKDARRLKREIPGNRLTVA